MPREWDFYLGLFGQVMVCKAYLLPCLKKAMWSSRFALLFCTHRSRKGRRLLEVLWLILQRIRLYQRRGRITYTCWVKLTKLVVADHLFVAFNCKTYCKRTFNSTRIYIWCGSSFCRMLVWFIIDALVFVLRFFFLWGVVLGFFFFLPPVKLSRSISPLSKHEHKIQATGEHWHKCISQKQGKIALSASVLFFKLTAPNKH
jgi:hypothetical protein